MLWKVSPTCMCGLGDMLHEAGALHAGMMHIDRKCCAIKGSRNVLSDLLIFMLYSCSGPFSRLYMPKQ